MELKIPLFVFCACLISVFSDKLLVKWIPSSDMKSIVFGLLIGLAIFSVQKSRAARIKISIPFGVFVIVAGFAITIVSAVYTVQI
ncbi:hypothetical protein MU1_08870 [Paenibacillus glycanilyticus]|uniref:Uncharacterized protein n=1 Tax=Paenibacillus glycanilyticus TaxID=126569 RepID=A0ABQ6GBA7_9BACL|nr:hypothetical protein MU1_08870 [Paenibacillus glycanilyticus]